MRNLPGGLNGTAETNNGNYKYEDVSVIISGLVEAWDKRIPKISMDAKYHHYQKNIKWNLNSISIGISAGTGGVSVNISANIDINKYNYYNELLHHSVTYNMIYK